jgi:hypothetical protein
MQKERFTQEKKGGFTKKIGLLAKANNYIYNKRRKKSI